MTRHPTARRVHHADVAGDDLFVARAFEASSWASRNRQKIIIGAVIAALVIVGLLIFGQSRRSTADRATTELVRMRAIVQSGNTPMAISELEKYVASYGSSASGHEARLMLGQQYLLSGDAAKAVTAVSPAADDVDTAEGVQAALLLAAAHESANAAPQAEEVYLRISERAPYLYMKQEALDNAARIRLAAGNAAGAVELLQKLVDMTPETAPERDVFSLRLGEAQAKAGSGTTGS